MDNRDCLLQLASRVDNSVLELLAHTSAWNLIRDFADGQHFWYLRVQHLLGRELQQRSEAERDCKQFGTNVWKSAYYTISKWLAEDRPYFTYVVLSNLLSVQILLEVGHDPSVVGNQAIRHACALGYAEVVKILLEDGRVDPTAANNHCIITACGNNHPEVVKVLLNDGRADPTAANNHCIITACSNNHSEVVKLLLADPRIGVGLVIQALRHARLYRQTEVIKLLEEYLEHARQ